MCTICGVVRIDASSNVVEILHRHLTYMVHGMSYFLMTIGDDKDLKRLLEMAKQFGSERIQCLYLKTCGRSIGTEEVHALQDNPTLTTKCNIHCKLATTLPWKPKLPCLVTKHLVWKKLY